MKDLNQMMPRFHELLREADIHMNHMIESQTGFHTASRRYLNILLNRIFSKTLPNIGSKKLVYKFLKPVYLLFCALEQC